MQAQKEQAKGPRAPLRASMTTPLLRASCRPVLGKITHFACLVERGEVVVAYGSVGLAAPASDSAAAAAVVLAAVGPWTMRRQCVGVVKVWAALDI